MLDARRLVSLVYRWPDSDFIAVAERVQSALNI